VQATCVFEGRRFSGFTEMVEILLHEANEQIVKIDMGKRKNTYEERAYAKWRLLHLQHCFGECVPEEYRKIYNSLWSHVYRLEHQVDYRHPYTVYLLEKLFDCTKSNIG
jgi:hypothetical protein